MKTFAEFQEAMNSEELKKELNDFLSEKMPGDQETTLLMIVEFAADRGYAVTTEDLCAEIASEKELSDEEMENVAGGLLLCWNSYHCVYVHKECFFGMI